MIIRIDLKETSQTIEVEAKNAYTKGPFYCVYRMDGKVVKYPVADIHRVVEDYGVSAGNAK